MTSVDSMANVGFRMNASEMQARLSTAGARLLHDFFFQISVENYIAGFQGWGIAFLM
jgi:hypothetical protein